MESSRTLTAMFEANKQVLEGKLSNLSLPDDSKKIQQIVSNYLNEIFDQQGEFRQNLSQSEDYILQSALMLLNAQQDMLKTMTEKQSVQQTPTPKIESQSSNVKKENTLLGTTVGSVVGSLAGGSWGAVFGAIAGTAIILYYDSIKQTIGKQTPHSTTPIRKEPLAIVQPKIDTNLFLEIISRICQSVDNLIATFRTQIQRVVAKYEEQEKSTLEKDYSSLLDSIQSLLGVAYTNQSDDKRLKKMDQRLEQLVDSLENYDLEVVTYSNETSSMFEQMNSDKVTEPTMICPAIVKKGEIIRKGKVFIKL